MTKLIVNTDCPKETIDKNIYGHFSEHLGRCGVVLEYKWCKSK